MRLRVLTFTLALLMLAGCLCACTPKEGGSSANTTGSNFTDYGTLGKKDWGGRACSILGVYDTHEPSFEIFATGNETDSVSQSAFRRNERLETMFNVSIEQVGDEDSDDNFTIDMMSQMVHYDIAFLYRDYMPKAIVSHYFYDIMELPYIDFRQPYYTANTIESMKISGKLFHMCSDFSLVDKSRISTLFYNRSLATDFGLSDIFTDVRNGEWTFEKFASNVKLVSFDMNSDEKMDYENDRFGLTIGSKDECISFWSGMGAKFVATDESGAYELQYGSQLSLQAVQKCQEIFTNTDYFFASTETDNYEGAGKAFNAGRSLYYSAILSSLPSIAGEVEFAYTVLPYPKYDETQANYVSNNNNRYCATFGVPVCALDPDFSAFMIEALSWQSTETTLKSYYDVNCKIRNSYDPDCSDMLDVLFDSLSFDFAFLYDDVLKTDSNTPKSIISSSLRKKDKTLTAYYTENSEAQEALMKKLVKELVKKS